jgi:hypothetical protein
MISFIALSIAFYVAISYGRRQGRREAQREQADGLYAQQQAWDLTNVTRLRK